MKVIVSGATGLVGEALTTALLARRDTVVALTRNTRSESAMRMTSNGVHVREWRLSEQREEWWNEVETADAIVNLAGEPIADGRWTAARKLRIRDSRISATRSLVRATNGAAHRPPVFVSASAIGYYGFHGDEEIDEDSPAGTDFLASVCRDWEAAATEVTQTGIRLAIVRLGVVLSPKGGALAKMALPFRLFAGGPVGDGRQWVSWIHIDDVVGMILFALEHEEIHGPMNATAPEPVRNGELAAEIGTALDKPSWMPAPKAAIRLALGELAEVLLEGQRVLPVIATRKGYGFAYPKCAEAVRSALARGR